MNPLLRQAVPDDAAAIARVHIASWQAAYRGQLPDQFLDSLSAEFERRSDFWRNHISAPPSPQHEVWVATVESAVEGFVAAGPARQSPPDTGEIYAIYVSPERWSAGLGRALLSHGADRLAATYPAAILWVLESNTRARQFYNRAGWVADGETKLETLPDGIELREVRYGKCLRR